MRTGIAVKIFDFFANRFGVTLIFPWVQCSVSFRLRGLSCGFPSSRNPTLRVVDNCSLEITLRCRCLRFAYSCLLTRQLLQTSIYILLVERPDQVSVPINQCTTDRAKCSCQTGRAIEKLILTLPVHSMGLADDTKLGQVPTSPPVIMRLTARCNVRRKSGVH